MNSLVHRATLAQLRAVWWSAPAGLGAIAAMALCIWLPLAWIALNRPRWLETAATAGTVGKFGSVSFVGLTWSFVGSFFGFLLGLLFGAVLARCAANKTLSLAPGFPGAVRRSIFLGLCTTWLLFGATGLLLMPLKDFLWFVPWSVGITALGFGLGLALIGLRSAVLQGFVWLLVALSMTARYWVAPAAEVIQPHLQHYPHGVHLTAGSAGFVALLVWAFWVRALPQRLLHANAKISAAKANATSWWQSTPQQSLYAGAHNSLPSHTSGLMLPQQARTWATELGLLAFTCATHYAIVKVGYFPGNSPWLVVWPTIAGWAAMAHAAGAWASPRLLLLPNGAARQAMAGALFRQAVRGSLLRWLVYAGLSALAVCAGSGSGAVQGFAFVTIGLAGLVLSAAVAVALPRTAHANVFISMRPMFASAVFALFAASLAEPVFGLPATGTIAWLNWALAISATGILLAGLLMAYANRVWRRIDWARLPAEPQKQGSWSA